MLINNKYIQNIIIIYFALYMIIGNAGRFINVSWASDNLLITEVVLYILVISFYASKVKKIKELTKNNIEIIGIMITFLVFSLIGFIYHNGEYIKSIIYSIRIVLQLSATLMFASVLLSKYKKDILKVFNVIIYTFLGYTVVGWTMLLAFPESYKLWEVLADIGIKFNGDPHISRFMGTFFDPNYISSILIIPILICVYIYFNCEQVKRDWIYLIYSIYFTVCMLFTYSRSGILGLAISSFIIMFIFVYRIVKKREKFDKKAKILSITAVSMLIVVLIFKAETIIRLISRFSNIFNDPSAQHRFIDFSKGIKFMFSSFYVSLFGIGYNYVQYDLDTVLGALDSSIINTFICFGFIGTSILMYFLIKYFKKIIQGYKKLDSKFIKYFMVYIIAALVICNFNNLLYYQFFIIPLLTLLNYGYIYNYEQHEEDNNLNNK